MWQALGKAMEGGGLGAQRHALNQGAGDQVEEAQGGSLQQHTSQARSEGCKEGPVPGIPTAQPSNSPRPLPELPPRDPRLPNSCPPRPS